MTVVGIVGAGAVGQAVGTALVADRFAGHIVIASRRAEQGAALAADLADMAVALWGRIRMSVVADLDELRRCDAVVLAVRGRFCNTKAVDVRMGGLAANVPIVREIAQKLRGYNGVVLVVTNPVDVLARLVAETSGCRVYGVGANLDTARFRAVLGAAYGVPAWRVDGWVVGEHGDAAVCCLSATWIAGQLVDPADPRTRAALAAFASRSTAIAGGLGRVRAGAAGAVLSALHVTLGRLSATEPLSVPYRDGVWLGQPVEFATGTPRPCLPVLTEAEQRQIDAAHAKLHAAYRMVQHQLSTMEPEEMMQ